MGRNETTKGQDLRSNLPKTFVPEGELTPGQLAVLERVAASKVRPKAAPTQPDPSDGPTRERRALANNHISVGDDKRGTKIIQLLDSVLDRTYARLINKSGSADQDDLRIEYAALQKYHEYTNAAGFDGAIRSIDFGQTGGAAGEGRSFLANSERQAHARNEIDRAHDTLSEKQKTVVLAVVIADQSIETAGVLLGKRSATRAKIRGRDVLRAAGTSLARLWGLTK